MQCWHATWPVYSAAQCPNIALIVPLRSCLQYAYLHSVSTYLHSVYAYLHSTLSMDTSHPIVEPLRGVECSGTQAAGSLLSIEHCCYFSADYGWMEPEGRCSPAPLWPIFLYSAIFQYISIPRPTHRPAPSHHTATDVSNKLSIYSHCFHNLEIHDPLSSKLFKNFQNILMNKFNKINLLVIL